MLSETDFYRDVYQVVRQVPLGKVVTYGGIARLVGQPHWSRKVGRAMACAPRDVPCHRVVNAGGGLVPGWEVQRKLLEEEGVRFKRNGKVDMKLCIWNFWQY